MNRSIGSITVATILTLLFLCGAHSLTWAQEVVASHAPIAIVQVAGGAEHTCALTADGDVLCWGNRYALALMGFAWDDQPFPLPISGITETIQSLAAGGFHTCAVTSQGRVKCWGWNNYGVLGGEQTVEMPIVDVATVTETVSMVALGNIHTCILTESGGVKCWGWNRQGELGNNSLDNSYTPVDVVGLSSGVSAIDSGGYHTCALTEQQEVLCWGDNRYGQLGDGSVTISRTTPVAVSGLSGVSEISVGGYHTCALANGQVKCWGSNSDGQLGDGTTVISSSLPVDIVGLTDVQEVAAYAYHTCARLANGDLRCWGNNTDGQLGDSTKLSSNTPVAVVGLAGEAAALAQGGAFNIFVETYGGDFTCAALTDGDAQSWGSNRSGQLGNGGVPSTTPTSIARERLYLPLLLHQPDRRQ
jgi:alpha-tubulin suppressor-like RCC1 family protein